MKETTAVGNFFSNHPLLFGVKKNQDYDDNFNFDESNNTSFSHHIGRLTKTMSKTLPDKLKNVLANATEHFGVGGKEEYCNSLTESSSWIDTLFPKFVMGIVFFVILFALFYGIRWGYKTIFGKSDLMPVCFDITFNSTDPNLSTTEFFPPQCDNRSGVVTSSVDGSRWSYDSSLNRFQNLFSPIPRSDVNTYDYDELEQR